MSAEAETDNPQSELRPGIDLLGQVDELFFDMYDRYEPVKENLSNHIYEPINEPSLYNCSQISKFLLYMRIQCQSHVVDVHGLSFFSLQSYDATTHFVTTMTGVLNTFGKSADISSALYMHE